MLLGFLLVLLVLVCVALTIVILLQQSEGGAFGMGGSPSGLLTARGAGDLLTRTTSVLAGIFFALCLLLTILSARSHGGAESVVDRLKVDALDPDALNKAMRPAVTASGPVAPTPAAGAPAATPSFQAPAPQVHVAPAGSAARTLATPPATSTDEGARGRASRLLGYTTAPQSAPTVAPQAASTPATAASAPSPSTAAAKPPAPDASASGGNTTH